MPARTVPLRAKILYGVADVALNVKNVSLNQFLLFFYADVVRVPPGLVGAALFVGKAWDAVTDPVMGYISDTTRSRWGRRRPYVLLSAVPMGACYYLLFSPPDGAKPALAWYLAAMYVLLFTLFTIFATPYLAWGAELAQDYHERTAVVQIRALFGVVGGVIGATMPVLIANRFPDQRLGFSRMALILGALITLTALVTGLGVRDAGRHPGRGPTLRHFLAGLRQTFANRAFRVIFATFCLVTTAASLGQSVQLIVIKYWLDLYDFFPAIALVFGVCFVGSFPLWMRLSQRVGKRRAFMVGLGLGCVVPFGWLLVPPGHRVAMLAFMVAAGLASGSVTLAMSQAIDVVDLDELHTGEQRAGAYFGVWTLGLKSMNALGILLGGVLLEVVGYVPDVTQDPRTLWWLIMLVGPAQAGVHAVGLLAFRRVRFDVGDVHRIQAELQARRRSP